MRLLLFDIETSPNVVYSWTIGRKVSLSHDNIVKERQIICICWKWVGENKVHSIDWGKKQNDRSLLVEFSKVLNEADVAIAHNGDRYDIRFINGRLAFHDLPPVGEVTTIDTLKQSRKVFFINSHRLDYLGQFLGLGRKLDTGGFGLWKSVMDGDEKSLAKMIRYCKQDVKLLESVYEKVRKYAPQSVHMGVLNHGDRLSCKACGADDTRWSGYRIRTKITYRTRTCNQCGHFWRTEIRAEEAAV